MDGRDLIVLSFLCGEAQIDRSEGKRESGNEPVLTVYSGMAGRVGQRRLLGALFFGGLLPIDGDRRGCSLRLLFESLLLEARLSNGQEESTIKPILFAVLAYRRFGVVQDVAPERR